MKKGSEIKAETPSTTKKHKAQDNRKTAKSRKKIVSTQKNAIQNNFLKNEEPQRDLFEENNEPTNSSVKESPTSFHNQSSSSLSKKNEKSNSSVIEISTLAFYLKIQENKAALSSRALNVVEQAISMSSNNDLSPSGRQKTESATEKEQLKKEPAEGSRTSIKTMSCPTFVDTNQSKVEMKISGNIGNSTTVNSKDELNTGNIKDNEIKCNLNYSSVNLISDDSGDEQVLPQIDAIARKNLIGKDSDYNQTNDENPIACDFQGTYSLGGSGNTVMFDDNSLSQSENSPNIPKNSSLIEKKKSYNKIQCKQKIILIVV